MRCDDQQAGNLFNYVSPEARVPADHPVLAIRRMTDAVLWTLRPPMVRSFGRVVH